MSEVDDRQVQEEVVNNGEQTNDEAREPNRVQGLNETREPNRDQGPQDTENPIRGEGTDGNTSRKRERLPDDREEEEPAAKKICAEDAFVVKQLCREEDEGKWTLHDSLAAHFVHHTKTHITDVDMKRNMKPYSLPTNVDCVPSMDNTFRTLLKKEKATTAIDTDGDWETVQRKILDVMGPLGKVWVDCKRYERGEYDDIDMTEQCDRLDMAVLSLAHAIQKVTWFRRIHSLSALGTHKNAKETLKEDKVRKIFEEDTSNSLFPKEFDEHLKADKGSRTNLLTHFKPADEKKKTPSSTSKTNGGKERRVLKRAPFSSRPSNSGGGGYDGGRFNDRNNNNNNGYTTYGKYKGQSSGRGGFQGKQADNSKTGQHAFISRLVARPKTCSSISNSPIPNKGGDSSAGWKNCQVLSQLEADNQRPSNSRYCERMGDSINGFTKSNKTSPLCKDELCGGTGNGSGDRKHADQGGHQGGYSQGNPILEQCVRHPQRGGPISSHHKPEGVKQLCPLPSLQDGGVEGCKIPSKKRGLDVQNRSEGCLLLSPTEHTIPEVRPFQLERETVRVSLPSLRLRPSPKDIYKINESSRGSLETPGDTSCDLPRRHVDNRIFPRGGDKGKGHHHVPLLSPGTNSKHQKISPHPITDVGVPRSDSGQRDHVLLSLRKEGSEIDFKVSGGTQQPCNDTKKSLFVNRKTLVNGCSSHSSSASAKVSSTDMHQIPGPQNALRVNDISLSGRDPRAKMVDRELGSPEGTTHASSTPRDGHLLRCSQDRGLGGSVSPWINGGSVVRIGKRSKHKSTGANSSRASYQNFHEGPQTNLHPHEDRQHLSPFVHCQDGGDSEPAHVDSGKEDLAVSFGARDHDYCGMDSIPSEHSSRLGVEERVRLGGMEAVSSSVSINLSSAGTTRHRPLCIKNIPSDPKVLQLESRSRLPGSRCFQTEMGGESTIRIPSILPNYKGLETGGAPICRKDDSNHSTLANPAMVPSTHEYVHSSTIVTASISKSSVKSFGFGTPTTERLLSKAGGLASLRSRLLDAGISEESSSLIIHSRREGTSQTYESAWKSWSLWCSERGVDPFACPINSILDYLTYLFHIGTPSRTIGGHRSAISAYHHPVVVDSALVTTGRHPLVSALMSGINNLRPPQPRYSFTWEVEFVLGLFRSWPLDLTPKQLTMKVITLLALIGIPRGAELKLFDLRYIADHGQKYIFHLAGTVKNVDGGTKPKPIEFHRHLDDVKLCPMACIDQYLALTEPWRVNGQPTAFFLCHKKPHNPASKSTLARWIKDVLLLADVDTKVFKAHSVRGASSSKALLKGLSVKEVVDQGRWSLESTWQKYYHKKVNSASKRYQDSILRKL